MKDKYTTHIEPNLARIESMLSAGADIKDVAKAIGVGYSTLWKYLDEAKKGSKRYEALKEAFARGCVPAREKVESALFRSATGYTVKVLKHYKVKKSETDPVTGRKTGEREELMAAYDEVHVPGNVTAQMFWLANRASEEWKYKPAAAGGADIEDLAALADMLRSKG